MLEAKIFEAIKDRAPVDAQTILKALFPEPTPRNRQSVQTTIRRLREKDRIEVIGTNGKGWRRYIIKEG